MVAMGSHRVRALAKLSGVSVRTLHHYDAIGLLVPKRRSRAGYRLYDESDLLRLQQILIQRELGLPLERIKAVLDDPAFDRRAALEEQRRLLSERAEQTQAMLRAVEHALAVIDGRKEVSTMNLKQIFDGFDPAKYEDEARERWGQTDAYRVSKQRTERYTAEDWQRLKEEQTLIYADAFQLMKAGRAPDSPEALAVAERHRASIDRWFYPCSRQMHRGLSDLYENDARFAENIDRHGEGLTTFLIAAIRANAARD
jgi:DNA-binding transcriptional MerR regulator